LIAIQNVRGCEVKEERHPLINQDNTSTPEHSRIFRNCCVIFVRRGEVSRLEFAEFRAL
jgi:hypothetical protein